ncbi:hypothetical protein [Prevotella dentalis]|uniref:hypothetical protein n=1 Tax=Prevotella dentalis TaxID=52227 RepID=UPI0026591E9B|nr:hypothetical protein [Prevotella dentalis]MCF2636176.1 hypothetical protein [Prevotella dentalis]
MLTGAAFFLPLSRWLAVSTALPVSAVVPSAIATILLSVSTALPTIAPSLLSFSTALPTIAPSLLSISTTLLSISVGMGMASAAPEGVLARLETMSVGFWLTTFYVPVNSISLNWFGGVAVNHLLCKCHHLHRVSRYRCRDGDGLGWLVTYDTRPRAY